ncbi:Spindle pole body component alp4 [Smittium culicis]|uniref:Spindle pole body component n=1 Tax=Smittium culicis TaxID=133412 RepID=A0A1R1YU68_9FUNG|nr:Spindle pole body component alp4 [Smittium culicis]
MNPNSHLQYDNLSKSYSDEDSQSLKYLPKYYESSFRERRHRVPPTERHLDKITSTFPKNFDPPPPSSISPPNILSLQLQEIVLIQDLFNVLLGFQGNYILIKKNSSKRSNFFKPTTQYITRIQSGFDNSLFELALKISQIAINYMELSDFINLYSSPHAGQVNQALSAALKHFEMEYINHIIETEVQFHLSTIYNPFTLLRLSVLLSSYASIMLRLSSLVFSFYKQSYSIELKNTLRDQELGLATSADPNSHSLLDDFSSSSSTHDSDSSSSSGSEYYSDDSISSSSTNSNNSLSDSYLQSKKRRKSKKSSHKKRIAVFLSSIQKINIRGGATLNVIANEMKNSSGDQISSDLYSYILSSAAEPFLSLLRQWLHFGSVNSNIAVDSDHKEFMISRSEGQSTAVVAGSDEFVVITNPSYSSKSSSIISFTLNEYLTPEFLRSFSRKILLTGKYINVVRECSIEPYDNSSLSSSGVSFLDTKPMFPDSNDLMKAINGNLLYKEIDSCYSTANTALLQVLTKNSYLKNHLDAIKRYLLLDQADFLTNFFDLANTTLERFASDEVKDKLSSFLDSTLKNPTSSTYSDPFKDKISLTFSNEKLIDALSLLQSNKISSRSQQYLQSHDQNYNSATYSYQSNYSGSNPSIHSSSITCSKIFSLKIVAEFPASLILNPISMRKYSLIHRHILILKHLEWKLSSSWISHLKSYSIITRKRFRAVESSSLMNNKDLSFINSLPSMNLKNISSMKADSNIGRSTSERHSTFDNEGEFNMTNSRGSLSAEGISSTALDDRVAKDASVRVDVFQFNAYDFDGGFKPLCAKPVTKIP